jgi:hypothetical protein
LLCDARLGGTGSDPYQVMYVGVPHSTPMSISVGPLITATSLVVPVVSPLTVANSVRNAVPAARELVYSVSAFRDVASIVTVIVCSV